MTLWVTHPPPTAGAFQLDSNTLVPACSSLAPFLRTVWGIRWSWAWAGACASMAPMSPNMIAARVTRTSPPAFLAREYALFSILFLPFLLPKPASGSANASLPDEPLAVGEAVEPEALALLYGIGAAAAVHGVHRPVARRVEGVVAGPAVEHVLAALAAEHVVAGTTRESAFLRPVVALAAAERVVA